MATSPFRGTPFTGSRPGPSTSARLARHKSARRPLTTAQNLRYGNEKKLQKSLVARGRFSPNPKPVSTGPPLKDRLSAEAAKRRQAFHDAKLSTLSNGPPTPAPPVAPQQPGYGGNIPPGGEGTINVRGGDWGPGGNFIPGNVPDSPPERLLGIPGQVSIPGRRPPDGGVEGAYYLDGPGGGDQPEYFPDMRGKWNDPQPPNWQEEVHGPWQDVLDRRRGGQQQPGGGAPGGGQPGGGPEPPPENPWQDSSGTMWGQDPSGSKVQVPGQQGPGWQGPYQPPQQPGGGQWTDDSFRQRVEEIGRTTMPQAIGVDQGSAVARLAAEFYRNTGRWPEVKFRRGEAEGYLGNPNYDPNDPTGGGQPQPGVPLPGQDGRLPGGGAPGGGQPGGGVQQPGQTQTRPLPWDWKGQARHQDELKGFANLNPDMHGYEQRLAQKAWVEDGNLLPVQYYNEMTANGFSTWSPPSDWQPGGDQQQPPPWQGPYQPPGGGDQQVGIRPIPGHQMPPWQGPYQPPGGGPPGYPGMDPGPGGYGFGQGTLDEWIQRHIGRGFIPQDDWPGGGQPGGGQPGGGQPGDWGTVPDAITPPPDPNRRVPTREQHQAKIEELFKKHGGNRDALYAELREWQGAFGREYGADNPNMPGFPGGQPGGGHPLPRPPNHPDYAGGGQQPDRGRHPMNESGAPGIDEELWRKYPDGRPEWNWPGGGGFGDWGPDIRAPQVGWPRTMRGRPRFKPGGGQQQPPPWQGPYDLPLYRT